MSGTDKYTEEKLRQMAESFSGMKPSGRKLGELLDDMLESFVRKNGHVPTEEELIRLTDEAREEIRREKEATDTKQ